MTTEQTKPADEPQMPAEDSDTEGHNMWINPSASREMTNSRSRDMEREMRDRQRAKEAKEAKQR
jgi:hypothetical protein